MSNELKIKVVHADMNMLSREDSTDMDMSEKYRHYSHSVKTLAQSTVKTESRQLKRNVDTFGFTGLLFCACSQATGRKRAL